MRIHGIDGLSPAELEEAIQEGGRFVFYEYCISCVVFTLRRPSDICFVRGYEWGWVRGLPYTLVTLLLGWWGLPWGFIYTPLALVTNIAGGRDVTYGTREYLASQPGWSLEPPEPPLCDDSSAPVSPSP
jgi:hypothetical protein